MSVYNTYSGVKLNLAVLAAGGTVTATYCSNLNSLVGSLCSEKYFLLFACTSAPLRVEIQLVSSSLYAVCAHTALTSFSVSNC